MPSTLEKSAADAIEKLTALVPDFPKPGIVFRDLTPVFADGSALRLVTDALVEPFRGRVDVVAGVEARGFVLAAAAAYALGVEPRNLPSGCRVLVLDDILATGGTLAAATTLVERAGWTVTGVSVVLELDGLGGREALPGRDIRSLVVG